MEIHSAAIFLASSLLIGFGLLFIAVCVVLLNNLFHNYWKPIKIVAYHTVEMTSGKKPKQSQPKTSASAQQD